MRERTIAQKNPQMMSNRHIVKSDQLNRLVGSTIMSDCSQSLEQVAIGIGQLGISWLQSGFVWIRASTSGLRDFNVVASGLQIRGINIDDWTAIRSLNRRLESRLPNGYSQPKKCGYKMDTVGQMDVSPNGCGQSRSVSGMRSPDGYNQIISESDIRSPMDTVKPNQNQGCGNRMLTVGSNQCVSWRV